MSYISEIPYKDRTFVVDDSDRELFIKMKSIVDANFPPATNPMLLELYRILWQKHKRIAYKELSPSTIYIHFPKINIFVRIIGTILLRFTSKDEDDEEEL